jgi:predicted NBD/HSP70 family sugar kinase
MERSRNVQAKSERDEHLVEYVVRRFGPISRARIHEMTQIRPSATSQIVRRLLDEGRLLEDGVENGRLGRKGALLRINEESRIVAVLQFDDEAITAGIANLRPTIRKTRTSPTPLNGGVDALVRQLVTTMKGCLRGIAPETLAGIGIADPGLVDSRRGMVLSCSTIPFWREVPIKAIFEREFGVPVTVETHTRAKAVAERDGSGNSRETMIYIDYGAGIGAGLVTDGRLLYGQTSGAGEFGHMHVVENDTACNCGSFGCLEAVAGLRAVETRVRRAVADGGKTEVLEMAGGDAARISGWMVFEAASRGDKIAGNTVAAVGRYLGLGIANLVNLFNPGAVVLDWRLRTAGDALLNEIDAIVKLQALREFTANLQIRYAAQGTEAGLLGMARMVLDEHMAIPALKEPRFLQESQ